MVNRARRGVLQHGGISPQGPSQRTVGPPWRPAGAWPSRREKRSPGRAERETRAVPFTTPDPDAQTSSIEVHSKKRWSIPTGHPDEHDVAVGKLSRFPFLQEGAGDDAGIAMQARVHKCSRWPSSGRKAVKASRALIHRCASGHRSGPHAMPNQGRQADSKGHEAACMCQTWPNPGWQTAASAASTNDCLGSPQAPCTPCDVN